MLHKYFNSWIWLIYKQPFTRKNNQGADTVLERGYKKNVSMSRKENILHSNVHVTSHLASLQKICSSLFPVKYEERKTFFNPLQAIITPLVFFRFFV